MYRVPHTHTNLRACAHMYGVGRETWPPRRDLEDPSHPRRKLGKGWADNSVSLPGTRKHFELRHRTLRAPRSDQIRVFDTCSQPTE